MRPQRRPNRCLCLEVVAYIWLGQAFFVMLPWNIDEEFAQKVRDGSVAYDLLRPVDLYAFWYSHTLAYRIAPTTLRPSLWGSWPSWCSHASGWRRL